ncbi:MAG TPA: DNA polymerase III subunit alpha, partial [Acidimicrobiales bacterium]|nr:DNA polymerase III subunit alpha [Acidimicrobiales bacterium]
MADSFTHLHVHTEYSMLDGAARLDELVAAAAADGQPALGITDHGNMYGILDFYRACKDRGVKPILGTEAYMAHDHRSERIAARGRMDDSGGEGEGDKKPWYHLTLLAESEVGYKNLIQLASRSFMEGYYRKPKVDWELLEEHSEGLIATTGCLGGHVLQAMVPKAIMDPDKQQADPLSEDERFDNAVKLAGRLQDIFGRDNLFVELQDHGIPAQQWSNPRLAELAKAIRAPLLATNDSHYVHREDALSHDALLCVQTNSLVSDTNRFKFHGDDHYLKSAEEMRYLFRELPTACDNTLWVAERCEVEITFGKPQLPNFPLPPGFATDDDYLRHLVFEGARKRWGDQLDDSVTERLVYELKVIGDMGFSSYFLITWDLIKHARDNGIRVGPGRGCLHGDTQIWTTEGYKPIRDVRVGDEVRTHTGAIRKVSNTFRYEVDEPLVTIRGYSGGGGVSMTADHKVLVRRGELETADGRLRGGAKFARSVSSPLEWVPASEVRVGDLLCIPRPPSPGTASASIDVAPLLPVPLGDCTFEVTADEIIERVPVNAPYPHSIREISRVTGVSRNAITTVLDQGVPFEGPIAGSARRAIASGRMRDRLVIELRSRGFESLASYRDHLERNEGRARYPHSAMVVAREAGLNAAALRNVLATYPEEGPIEHHLAAGSRSLRSRDTLAAELRRRGFDSFEAWDEYLRSSCVTEIRTPRFIEVDDDLLFVLGAFASDGWIRQDSERVVGFAERRSEMDDTLPLMIKRIWGLDVTRCDHATTDLTQTFVRSAAVRALFQHLVPDYRFTAQTKHLPEWCAELDTEQKRTLLAGLWWGDGSKNAQRSMYATSSHRLMQQVRDLLWAVGAPAGVQVDDREDERPEYRNRSVAWRIRTTPNLTPPKLQFGGADDDYVYSRVRSVESTAHVSEVFDLEVPEDHSFLTDSYIVHNSAAGCAVAYTLWITDLDPIKYDLLFERFLNPSRISMPDIDMDFDTRYRDEMIRYAAERYGRENVAQIITFGTIKARQAVRDAARVLGHDYGTGDRIAKAMPPLIMGRDTPLHACLEEHPKWSDGFKMAAEIRSMYETDPTCKEVIDVAKGLEGLRRSDGIHAAAVVITKDPLTTYLPIQRKPEPGKPIEEAPVVTQYEMHGVEDLGLLKMDFLGLRNLDIISDTLDLIEMTRGEQVDIDDVDLEDEPTYELLRRGDTIGVFQLESPPMRALMRSLAPDTFEDVAALVALYRPGPMAANMHNDYADRKNGRKDISYIHDDADEILGATYGLCIYQEQMMRLAQKFAGYSLADADSLRKAAGKKNRDIMAKERDKFVAGCEQVGYGTEVGQAWFDMIEPFADYAFNKSHSYGYGFIAYQIAYLKANYPAEYMAALLTSVKSNLDKAAVYLAECRAMGIPVTVADVNRSLVDFAPELRRGDDGGIDGAEIVFGMSAVRGVGTGHCELIIAEREANGPFRDFHDFCERVDPGVLNKKTVEALIKAG